MRDYLKRATPEFAELWHKVCDEVEQKEAQWIIKLRAIGVSASHPDDGWVNRETNEVNLVYPQFNDGVEIGSIIALGWPDKYRIVEITGCRDTMFEVSWWSFKELYRYSKTDD